jgi:type IV secretion system protein VirB10
MAELESTLEPAPQDIRPVVARAPNNRSLWLFGGLLAALATGLFAALETRRTEISSPATAVPPAEAMGATIAAPPELVIPPDYSAAAYEQGVPMPYRTALPPPLPYTPIARTRASRSGAVYMAPSMPAYTGPIAAPPPMAAPSGPAYAYRAAPALPPSPLKTSTEEGDAAGSRERAQASRLRNPSTTVPQGTIIQAVMETAFDSTRAGFARAVISRDVMSFDGSRVLIPKGSKLFGEYKADVALGQNRALIQWRRLTRPDCGIIEVDSPAAYPVGRAGDKGKVNSHFFTRFSGAILQSALDIGTGIATRSVGGDSYYFGVPSAMQGVVQQRPEQVKPTLTLRQGASVSVFVGRDLDFVSVE